MEGEGRVYGNCRRDLLALMRQVGLYRLEDSLVSCELEAYLATMEPVEAEIDSLLKNSFFLTAEEESLKRFERLLGLPVREQLEISKRREMAADRMAVEASDFHKEGLLKALRSAGLAAIIREQPGQGRITVLAQEMAGEPLNLDEARQAVKTFLPAHLEADFETNGTKWQEMDSLKMTFADFDRLSKSWNQIEMMNLEDW